MEPPLITVDDGHVLDRWRAADALALRRFDADPETARWFGWTVEAALALPDSHYEGDARERRSLEEWLVGTRLNLAIRGRSSGESVGYVELRRDGDSAEVSYNVDADLRGAGLAPRALNAFLDWAVVSLGLRQARLGCHAENGSSRRVAEKCGFSFAYRDGDELWFLRELAADVSLGRGFVPVDRR